MAEKSRINAERRAAKEAERMAPKPRRSKAQKAAYARQVAAEKRAAAAAAIAEALARGEPPPPKPQRKKREEMEEEEEEEDSQSGEDESGMDSEEERAREFERIEEQLSSSPGNKFKRVTRSATGM